MCACVRGQGVSVGKCKKVFAEVYRREWGREGEGKGEGGLLFCCYCCCCCWCNCLKNYRVYMTRTHARLGIKSNLQGV